MQGVILAVLDRRDAAAQVLAAARTLATLTGAARINGLVVRIPPLETILPSEQILTRPEEARIRAGQRQRADALRAGFDAWAATATSPGMVAECFDVESRADHAVSEWGRRADFVVLERPSAHPTEPQRQAIHAALFATDRPVLLVPPGRPPAPFGQRVAIAWRDDSRTRKAVLAALRWLGPAARVHVLAGAREGTPAPLLPEILVEHGISAELHVLPVTGQAGFAELLLAHAHALGCDMLVMGAFARHPTRSLILGGVTRHMLAHADLPVFMRH